MGARGGSLLNRDTIVERGKGGIKGNLSRQVDRKRGKGIHSRSCAKEHENCVHAMKKMYQRLW